MQDHQDQNKLKIEKSDEALALAIPHKLYFTIGEVANLCKVKTHVLRYWEQEFTQLSPVKRKGNRRYYQRKDVILIQQIKMLLYDQGFTIEGAKTQIFRAGIEIKTNVKTVEKAKLLQAITELENLLTVLEESKIS